MIIKKFKGQKRVLALLLALIMLISNANGFTINAFAETNSTVEVDSTSESNVDYSGYATGDLSSDINLLFGNDSLTNEEFDRLVNGDSDADNDIDASTGYPSSVDNSKSKYFPVVRSQRSIGSCVCWAEVYYGYTYARCRALDIEATDDNIMSPAFVYNQIKVQSGGTWYDSALDTLIQIGTPYRDTADFETYTSESGCRSWFPEKEIWEEAAENRLTGYTCISSPGVITSPDDSDLNEMKKYLSEGYLITYSTNIYGWEYRDIPEGSPYAGESIAIADNYIHSGHRMTIVGYNDDIYYDINGDGVIQNAERGAFKIVNSWGTGYENQGFCWVSYDALNAVSQAGAPAVSGRSRERVFKSMVVQYVTPEESAASGINMIMTLNTPARNELNIRVIAKDKNSTESYYGSFYPTNYDNYLNYALDGSVSATDGTLVFDLNNVITGINKNNVDNYTWSVIINDSSNNNNEVMVKELSIEADGNTVLESETNNAVLNGSAQTFEFSEDALKVEAFTVSKQAPIGLADIIDLTAKAKGGSGEYEYKFGTKFNGNEYDLSNGYRDSDSATNVILADIFSDGNGGYTDHAVGYHELFVVVRDKVTGKTANASINLYEVKPLKVTELKATTESGEYRVGQPISLHADVEYEATYRYNTRLFYYTFNGKETKFSVTSGSAGYDETFTPTEAGEYTFRYYIRDNMGQVAEKTIVVNVLPNQSVVYYNNPSWDNSNIHFMVDNGSWTSVPGVKMEESDNSDYKWMYTIDLGSENGATVCFNNGNDSWDSKNGQNYYVGIGKYGISNGVVEEIGMTATVDIAGEAGNVYATVNVKNGTAPYTYEYSIYRDGAFMRNGSTTNNEIYMSVYTKGVYKIDVKVTDACGNVCNVSETLDFPGLIIDIIPELQGPQKVGTELKFGLKLTNYYYYKFTDYSYWSVTKNGENIDFKGISNGIAFTPEEEGIYEITYTIPNYMGEYHTKSITYEVVGSNVTTVYYKNSSWQNAYVHYKTDNGSWTSVPGMKMGESDIEGYDWKYVIDLENSNGVTLCFNNGNSSWDNNNRANYYLEKGTYGIFDSNVVVISENNEFSASVSVDKEIGGTETKTTINVNTKNGTAVKYSYYVYPYGSEKSVGYGIKDYTKSNYGFTPYVAGTYTIEVEVTDDKGNVATDKIEKYVIEGPKFEYFTASVSSPQKTETSITLNSKFVNFHYDKYNRYYFIIDDGTTTSEISSTTSDCGTAVWTPEKTGTYTITAVFSTYVGAEYKTTMEYVISDGNVATVYYNNDSWTNANIHFKVDNGSWTSVPGVKMEQSDKSEYKWMYKIDLGDQTGATVCFNNGENSWDSGNGSNYYVYSGSYAVVNGNVIKLS